MCFTFILYQAQRKFLTPNFFPRGGGDKPSGIDNTERNKEIEKRLKREEKAASLGGSGRGSTSSVAGARSVARPRARAADDLSAQGSGLCARQAKGSSHAPEIPTPTPAVNLRFNIDGLTKGRERVGGFLVGEVEKEPE